jgi:hypothetical protein
MLTTHAPVPEQAPLQPLNEAVPVGAAWSVTEVPEAYEALQVLGHEIPDPEILPGPLTRTVRTRCGGGGGLNGPFAWPRTNVWLYRVSVGLLRCSGGTASFAVSDTGAVSDHQGLLAVFAERFRPPLNAT